MDHAALVDALADTWTATSSVLHGAGDVWDLPTGCPGWTVKDQLSHVLWAADIWRGVAPEEIELPDLDHVTGPVGRYMELAVQARRALPGADVLAEFDAAREAAIADLRGHLPDLEEPIAGPMGHQMPRSAFLGISVFDCWTHGHDIRCAIGADLDRSSDAARHSTAQALAGWGGRLGEELSIDLLLGDETHRVGDGPLAATVGMSWDDFLTLATGRDRPTGELDIDGDVDQAVAALARLPVTP